MKVVIPIAFLLTIIYFCCNSHRHDSITINFSKDTVYHVEGDSKLPSMLHLKLKGYANDTFMVNSILLYPGTLDTLLQMDWYNERVAIEFKRYKATKGTLEVSYKTF